MTDADRHQRWSEDLAAYMLGALEPDEAVELERHLQDCERCRGEMRWLDPAVHSLPEAVERQQPPARLRESLMAQARADARRAGSGTAEAGGPRRSLLPTWLRGGGSRGLRFAAGFAVLALVVAAAAGYEIGRGGSGGGGADSTVVSRQANGVTAKMVREGDGGTLRLVNVQQPPPGKVLEAWVRREGTVEPVPALFVPDRGGRAATTIADMRGVDTVMVTEEPRGGSEAPTSEPIVTMSVPQ
ncbi:MAG TPA: anti-sigma factor [Solirubrobacterales bacterium]|jgi:anti-sigma-K factor RskA|nr:anti-sigma factor [Solirubrobacterales bacterium]